MLTREAIMTKNTITLNNGVEMPAIGLGVFQSPPMETGAAVEAAIRSGYRHIDTAAAYGNERDVGEGIRRSGIARDDIFIETKIWISDYGYDETLHGFEKAVAKLGVERLDLLLRCRRISTARWRPIARWKRFWIATLCGQSGSAISCPGIWDAFWTRPGSCPR
jgi:2,5-diketo-D-gluconate reductase A